MSENEIKESEVKNETEAISDTTETSETSTSGDKSMLKFYLGAIAIVVVALLLVLYKLETEGRAPINIFGGIIEQQRAKAAVAVVNGSKITNADLETGINQFAQMAQAQGVDISEESIKEEIRQQALDVLINTELLRQEAGKRGHSITEEEITGRLDEIKTELGGEEVLTERMELLGIDYDKLYSDVGDELLIQKLLEEVFAEAAIEVTEEEIASVYETAGGGAEGVPPLEEVSEQVRAQIAASKEQEVLNGFIQELKDSAEVEVN